MNLQEIINQIVKEDNDGKLYIIKSDLDKYKLSGNDQIRLSEILKRFNVEVRDLITKEDRSPLVRDFEYGEQETYETRKLDEPVMANLGFSDNGDLISEDYKELDQSMDSFIFSNVVMKQERNKETGEITLFPSIQLNCITRLRLSELEVKHLMEYLLKKGIRVCGYSESLESEFENYDYYRTYKTQILPQPLTEQEVSEKFALFKVSKDPVIRQQLIMHNMRLVPYVTWKYASFYGIDIYELESYGYEGLIEAVERFDVTMGFKFSTFAISYINGRVKRGCQEILVGNRNDFSAAYLTALKVVENENQTTLEKSPELIDDVVDLLVMRGDVKDYDKDIIKRRINLLYMDPLEEFEDTLVAEDDLDEVVRLDFLKQALNSTLSTLTPKEEMVLRLRFGLEDGEAHTLAEIGKEFKVTGGRIGQIEAKALRKLRHPSRSRKLAIGLDEEIPLSQYRKR